MQCRVIVRRTRADRLEVYPEDQLTIDSDLAAFYRDWLGREVPVTL